MPKQRKRKLGSLDEQALDLVLKLVDLFLDLRAVVRGHASGDDRAGNTAGTAESDLGGDEHVRNVLVLAEQRQVKDDLDRLSVGRHHNELGDTTVQRLRGLIGTLLQLAEVGGLLSDVEDLLSGGSVGQRECARVRSAHFFG